MNHEIIMNTFKHWVITLKRYWKNLLIMKTKILSKVDYNLSNKLHEKAIEQTINFMYKQKLFNLFEFKSKYDLLSFALSKVENQDLIIELGVYKGTTINFLAEKQKSKIIYWFDSFLWLPEDRRWKFKKGVFALKTKPMIRENVVLIEWFFNETLPIFVNQEKWKKLWLVHVDCDLYSSTYDALNCLDPLITSWTLLLFDEYWWYPWWERGEHKALLDYCSQNNKHFAYIAYNSNFQQVLVQIE